MKTISRIYKFALLTGVVLSFGPSVLLAGPQNLDCKLYGPDGSAQMHSERSVKTHLVFSHPIAWREATSFELVYSSIFDPRQPLTLVANATSAKGISQTVEIKLDPPTAMEPSTRYGKVKAGDFIGHWYSTLGKFKEYEIQCFNF